MARTNRLPRLTDGEQLVVRDMLRFRALVTEHVAWRLLLNIDGAITVLERLCQRGIVRKEPSWLKGTNLWAATDLGARTAKSRYKARYLWPGGLIHDMALVDLADQLLLDNPDAIWLTEREIASRRASAARRGEPSGNSHRPDGMLIVDGQRIAIELELHKKTDPDAYARICRWYAEQPDVDGLRWYVEPGPARAAINYELERHGLSYDLAIHLQRLPNTVLVRSWAIG